MSTYPKIILHIGAPKCGSSALQTALSMTPMLRSGSGKHFRYTSAHQLASAWRVQQGKTLTTTARRSPYGYTSWPDLRPEYDSADIFATLKRTLKNGEKRGYVPIASSEGWINHHASFAKTLAEWGHPLVDVVVFLRPPVDWVNAAFWQWGVWFQPELDVWMDRSNMPYSFADDIAAWARIPNVRLTVRSQHSDVVAKFADLYDLPLRAEWRSNTSSSANLVGVLLRNRSFRPTGHQGQIEFVVQRWCPPVSGRKLWAILARHIHGLRSVRLTALETFREVLSADDQQDLLADSGWTDEAKYHPDILEGVTPLNEPKQFAPLFDSLSTGVKAAALACGERPPSLPQRPEEDSDIMTWDIAICSVLKTLLDLDERVRSKAVSAWKRRALSYLNKARQH